MIKKGTVCIWQNVIVPEFEWLNGIECVAQSSLIFENTIAPGGRSKGSRLGYLTDTLVDSAAFGFSPAKTDLFAMSYQLREKNPPQDELDEEFEKERELTT